MEEDDAFSHSDYAKSNNPLKRLLYRVGNKDCRRERLPPSISILSGTLRGLSPHSFRPRVVYIGPLHYVKEQASEQRKTTYVVKLLTCINSPEEEILKSCVDKVSPLLEKIKGSYLHYWRHGFCSDPGPWIIEMMVLDACFILGFTIHISEYRGESSKSYRGNMLPEQYIIFDLVMIENQIPFFVLDAVFQCTVLTYKPNTSLVEFLLPLLNLFNLFKADITTNDVSRITTTDHILSLLYECYKPRDPITSRLLTSKVQSVVDLDRAGVNFKPNRNPNWLMGMDAKIYRFPCFSWCLGKPTLRTPVLYVHDFTELVLRNLIAYEHESKQTHKYITSYAYSMDMLVDTEQDVTKLVDSGVLVNYMGSNQVAADMINNICKKVTWEHFFYAEEWDKLDKYCNSYWPKNITWLKKTYFNSPWSIIALIAGIILFALTIVQTIFTIKSAS